MKIQLKIIQSPKSKAGEVDLDGVAVKVRMPENFDINASKELSILLKTFINSGLVRIILDMSSLGQIESSSIGILINIAKAVKANKGDIIFLNVSKDIDEIFKIMHLHKFIQFHATEEEALKGFKIYA